MAVGDNLNDLEMLEFAGRPVVMGNALDELKTRGWAVTATNDEAGVARAYSTSCCSNTEISGTVAMGRRTSPRTASANR